jgi:hypothetical protein
MIHPRERAMRLDRLAIAAAALFVLMLVSAAAGAL